MERARKSSKKGEQNVDRLSALPDGVICHILSFLPTQRSVRTSILAKRWRFLWAHVPVLAFEFDHGNPKRATFPGIVNTVMLRHKVPNLSTFRITYTGADVDSLGCHLLETCITTAVERNVQNLHLKRLRVEVPCCVLTCKTLVELTMRIGVRIPPSSGPVSFPSLKKLHLYNLKVNFTRLISGCPVLEELIIEATKCRDPRGCCISLPTLKRLTIMNLLDCSIMFDNPDYVLTINTPALRYLHVDDYSSKHFSISLCTSLVEAEIYIEYLCEFDDFHHHGLLKLLGRICNVKSLKLTVICNEILDDGYGLMFCGSIAKFVNLTKLELSAPWCLLSKLLETPHHLQVLTIFEVKSHSKGWIEPATEERCECLLLNSLRTVRIGCFMCTEQGFNMVRYILRNAQVLEFMEIYSSSNVDLKKKFDAIRKITLFRRESKKCELDFS